MNLKPCHTMARVGLTHLKSLPFSAPPTSCQCKAGEVTHRWEGGSCRLPPEAGSCTGSSGSSCDGRRNPLRSGAPSGRPAADRRHTGDSPPRPEDTHTHTINQNASDYSTVTLGLTEEPRLPSMHCCTATCSTCSTFSSLC